MEQRPAAANTVVHYDPGWPELFERLRERIWRAVEDVALGVEHVGSTAVPGLAAKPVVDAVVIVRHPHQLRALVDLLARIGYDHEGERGVAGRESFRPTTGPWHHLYGVVAGSKPHRDLVLLRDYLRSHPEAAARYGARKRQVAHLMTPDTRQAYVEAKADLVEELIRLAEQERGLPEWFRRPGAGVYARDERERRFWLPDLPEEVRDPRRITDRYLTQTRLRLRRVESLDALDVVWKLTQKVRPDPGDPSVVRTTNVYLEANEVEALLGLPAAELEKVRFSAVFGSVDVYAHHLAGLVTAEIDPGDEDAALLLPPSAVEVTHDDRFTGAALAEATEHPQPEAAS